MKRRTKTRKRTTRLDATRTTTHTDLDLLKARRQVRLLSAENRSLSHLVANSSAQLEQVLSQVERIRPAILSYKPKDVSSSEVVATLLVGDWHTGLVVKSDEVQGYNAYDWKIAEARRQTMVRKLLDWVALHRNAYKIDELVVIALGDLSNGMIHLENLMYDEFGAPEQAVKAGQALAEMVATVAPYFKRVRVVSLATDNHSRLTKKVAFTGRGDVSMGFVSNAIAAAALSQHKNVTFENVSAIKTDVTILNKTFLVEHGNDIKCQLGIPYYGLQRLKMREAHRRAQTGIVPFDYMVVGHFHVGAFEEDTIINPSLCGTTPYDHAVGRHSKPGQTAFLVSEHGVFNYFRMDL